MNVCLLRKSECLAKADWLKAEWFGPFTLIQPDTVTLVLKIARVRPKRVMTEKQLATLLGKGKYFRFKPRQA